MLDYRCASSPPSQLLLIWVHEPESYSSPGCPRTHCVTQAGFKLVKSSSQWWFNHHIIKIPQILHWFPKFPECLPIKKKKGYLDQWDIYKDTVTLLRYLCIKFWGYWSFITLLYTFRQLYGDQASFFEAEKVPRIKHKKKGTVSMVNNGSDQHGSQVRTWMEMSFAGWSLWSYLFKSNLFRNEKMY